MNKSARVNVIWICAFHLPKCQSRKRGSHYSERVMRLLCFFSRQTFSLASAATWNPLLLFSVVMLLIIFCKVSSGRVGGCLGIMVRAAVIVKTTGFSFRWLLLNVHCCFWELPSNTCTSSAIGCWDLTYTALSCDSWR